MGMPGLCTPVSVGSLHCSTGPGRSLALRKKIRGWLWTDAQALSISAPECICRLALFLWGKQGSLIVLPLPDERWVNRPNKARYSIEDMKLSGPLEHSKSRTACLPITNMYASSLIASHGLHTNFIKKDGSFWSAGNNLKEPAWVTVRPLIDVHPFKLCSAG